MAAQMLSWLGSFVIKPGVKDMKEINLQAAAMTLAAARAVRELKSIARGQGTRAVDFRISDRPTAIAEHLAEHPEIIERATRDIERWRSKFTSGAQKRNR